MSFSDYMQTLAGVAVQMADEMGVTLDYTEASLDALEAHIRHLEEFIPPSDLMEQKAHHWGAYLGEVYRRNVGGEWEQWEDEYGKTAAIGHEETAIFPIVMIHKRLKLGKQEHVAARYAALKPRSGHHQQDAGSGGVPDSAGM